MTRKNQPRKGTAKIMAGAFERTQTSEAYWNIHLLWPNIHPMLQRLAEYVGTEVVNPKTQTTFYDEVVAGAMRRLNAVKLSGAIRERGRDRDILVHFCRGLVRETVKIHDLRVSVGNVLWSPAGMDFPEWRAKHQGELKVVGFVSEQDRKGKETLRRVARRLLSATDWEILDTDIPRLWTRQGEPLVENEFDSLDAFEEAQESDFDKLWH